MNWGSHLAMDLVSEKPNVMSLVNHFSDVLMVASKTID